jgi:hypothetical protein
MLVGTVAALFLAFPVAPAPAHMNGPCNFAHGFGSYGIGNWPNACWHPYEKSSPFNSHADAARPAVDNSRGLVSRLLAGGRVAYPVVGDPERPDGVATYYSQPGDPSYTLHCTEDWGTCPLEGKVIQIPASAKPAGISGTDAHMTIVDQETGWEYDLWAVTIFPENGGTVEFGWGGLTRIDGDGLGSYAVAARYGSLAGLVRSQELVSGHIRHALAMFVPCTEGWVYPADHPGYDCSDNGMSTRNALPMGAHFKLTMSRRKIRAHHFPRWKRAVLLALHRYGAYVADTSGDPSYWGFRFESSATYQSFGYEDPMVKLAQRNGIKPDDYNENGFDEYWFNLKRRVAWKKLEVVGPPAR